MVEEAKLEVFDLKHGWKLVKAAWAWLKKEIPNNMKPFFNEKSEFCIIDKRKTGKKEWELQDINGTTKTLHLSNEVLRANGGCHVDGWMDFAVGTGVATALEIVQWPKRMVAAMYLSSL